MNKLNLTTASEEDVAWEKERLAAKQQKSTKYLEIGAIVSMLVFTISVALMLFHIWILSAQRLELVQLVSGVLSGVMLLLLCGDFSKRGAQSKGKAILFGVCGAVILCAVVAVFVVSNFVPKQAVVSRPVWMTETNPPATLVNPFQ